MRWLLILLLAGCATLPPHLGGYTAPPTSFQRGVLDATNEYRASKGLPPFTHSALLSEIASVHAQDPASMGSHTGSDGSLPSDRATRLGYTWRTVAENIFITTGPPTPSRAVEGWRNSPGHNENLLRDVEEHGVARHTHNGTTVIVAVYATAS